MKVNSHPNVAKLIGSYQPEVQQKLLELRALILNAAKALQLDALEETLKWGEPSYLAKHGSTVRMDWKAKNPKQVALYFKCTSRLVPTFRMIYPDVFTYDGNRAIQLNLDAKLPKDELHNCLKAALNYHKVKHLPDLGMP